MLEIASFAIGHEAISKVLISKGINLRLAFMVVALLEYSTLAISLDGEWKLSKTIHNGIVNDYDSMIMKMGLGDVHYKIIFIKGEIYSGNGKIDFNKSTTWGGSFAIKKRNDGMYDIDIKYFKDGDFKGSIGFGIIRLTRLGFCMCLSNHIRPQALDEITGVKNEVRYYSK